MTGMTELLRAVAASASELAEPLEPTGPRAGADRGDPQTSTRVLHSAGGVEVGVWECTPGGWAIVDRPNIEVAIVLSGRATITDADGAVHPLEAGSLVTLPRGWSGRWDIAETLRKAFVVVG